MSDAAMWAAFADEMQKLASRPYGTHPPVRMGRSVLGGLAGGLAGATPGLALSGVGLRRLGLAATVLGGGLGAAVGSLGPKALTSSRRVYGIRPRRYGRY